MVPFSAFTDCYLLPAQPESLNFGRVYAAYGGYFILLSDLWGVYVDRKVRCGVLHVCVDYRGACLISPAQKFMIARVSAAAAADTLAAKQLVLDRGDVIGGAVSIAGALIISFWPR